MGHRILTLAVALACLAPTRAQQLRHGIADAAFVVVADPIGSSRVGEHLVAHRFRVVESLKGDVQGEFTVLETTEVADAPLPELRGRRLACLNPDRRKDLPAGGPYLRPTGYAGEQPMIDDGPAARQILDLVRTLVTSERGGEPAQVTATLVQLAQRGGGVAQREAIEVLRERDVLRSHIDPIDVDAMLARAVGETKDIDLKIALASLCAERRGDGVVEALCGALQQCQDERFALALGRIARHVHGEQSFTVLQRFHQQARGPLRDTLLLAIGATRTEAALDYLLDLRKQDGPTRAVDAALRAHGSVRAIDAVEPKKK